ncbi:Golgin subfamily A member 8S [Plecturocebus cupreus]
MLLSFSLSTCLAFLTGSHPINILTSENGQLKTALNNVGRAARHFEEESNKLAGCLQKALQQRGELERTPSPVSAQQDKADRMMASLHQVQLERDEYCQHIKGERFRWQQRLQKISEEVRTFKLEKREDAQHVQELERSLAHLRNQLAEAPRPEPPVGPSVAEQQLKFETNLLRKNLESLTQQLQAEVKNNENLNRLSSEQEKRLWQQEESLQEQKERMRLQEEELNNEKKNALQLVQQIKELQEKLHNQKVAFFNSAGAGAQEEQEQLCVKPQEQRVCYQHLAHPVASVQEPEAVAAAPAPASGTESESLCRETNQALQGAIEKLQSGFRTLRKEKVDLKERVEKLELLFIQLSGETDTVRKDINPYEQQRAVPKPQHQKEGEKQDKGKVCSIFSGMRGWGVGMSVGAGTSVAAEHPSLQLELQEPVFSILGDNEGYAKFLATAKNHVDEPTPGAPAPQEPGTLNKQGGNVVQPLCDTKTFPGAPGLGQQHLCAMALPGC